MTVAAAVLSIILAALVAFAAARKLSHRDDVVASYVRVGVPEDRLNALAAILLAGATGLVVGLVWAPIGLVAAAGLVVYFVLAIAAHIHADDAKNLPTPITMETLALAALILRVAGL